MTHRLVIKPHVAMAIIAVLGLYGCLGGDLLGADSKRLSALSDQSRPLNADNYSDHLSARYASLVEDESAAAHFYSSALGRQPESLDLLERAVAYELAALRPEKAVELALEAPRETSENAPLIRLLLTAKAFAEEKPDQALQILKDNQKTPFDPGLDKHLTIWATIDNHSSQTDFNAPVKDGLGYFLLGLELVARGEDEIALKAFEEGWKNGARFAHGADTYIRLVASNGDHQKARELVEEYYISIGDNPLIDYLSGQIKAGEVIKLSRLNSRQGAATIYFAYASQHLARRQQEMATIYLVLARMADPENEPVAILLSDLLSSRGEFEKANDILNEISDKSIYLAAAKARQAAVFYDMQQDDLALKAARKAMDVGAGRSLQMKVGEIYALLGRYEDAEITYTSVLDKDATRGIVDWRVLFARAGVRDKQGNWAGAENDLMESLSLAPETPELLNYLGYSWVDRGINVEAGFQMILQAVSKRPDAGYIRDSLGWAYYRLGHFEKAVEVLEEAAALDPADPTINDHLGDAYWKIGQTRQAQFQWGRVVEYSRDDALKAQSQVKLRDGLNAPDTLVEAYSTQSDFE